MTILNISKVTGPVVTKFHVEPSVVEGTKFFMPPPHDDSQEALRFAPGCPSVCLSVRHTLR